MFSTHLSSVSPRLACAHLLPTVAVPPEVPPSIWREHRVNSRRIARKRRCGRHHDTFRTFSWRRTSRPLKRFCREVASLPPALTPIGTGTAFCLQQERLSVNRLVVNSANCTAVIRVSLGVSPHVSTPTIYYGTPADRRRVSTFSSSKSTSPLRVGDVQSTWSDCPPYHELD